MSVTCQDGAAQVAPNRLRRAVSRRDKAGAKSVATAEFAEIRGEPLSAIVLRTLREAIVEGLENARLPGDDWPR